MNTLGQNCKFFRNKLGYTQQYVADKINMSQSNYALIEADKRDPDTDTLVLIANILQTTPNELLNVKSNSIKEENENILKEIDKKIVDNNIAIAANSKVDLGKLAQADPKVAKLINTLLDDFLNDVEEDEK